MVLTNLGGRGGRVFFFVFSRPCTVWFVGLLSEGDLQQVARNSSLGIYVFVCTRLLQEEENTVAQKRCSKNLLSQKNQIKLQG